MTEQLDRLIDELIDRPAMLAKEFAAALNAALRSGEKLETRFKATGSEIVSFTVWQR